MPEQGRFYPSRKYVPTCSGLSNKADWGMSVAAGLSRSLRTIRHRRRRRWRSLRSHDRRAWPAGAWSCTVHDGIDGIWDVCGLCAVHNSRLRALSCASVLFVGRRYNGVVFARTAPSVVRGSYPRAMNLHLSAYKTPSSSRMEMRFLIHHHWCPTLTFAGHFTVRYLSTNPSQTRAVLTGMADQTSSRENSCFVPERRTPSSSPTPSPISTASSAKTQN
jgi:hypothetical protein